MNMLHLWTSFCVDICFPSYLQAEGGGSRRGRGEIYRGGGGGEKEVGAGERLLSSTSLSRPLSAQP